MKMNKLSCALAVVSTLLCSVAWALPNAVTSEDTNDDAMLVLTTLDQAIEDDSRSRCTVRIRITGEDIQFSSPDDGDVDSVSIRVREDDALRDDTIWETSFDVTPEEIAAQLVDRTFDCTSNFGDDGFGGLELYAEAEVVKQDCGWTCLYDRPETSDLDIAVLEDDDVDLDDGDDSQGDSFETATGNGADRINRDQDWFVFSSETSFNVNFEVLHMAAYGRLDVALFNSNDDRVGDGDDYEGGTVVAVDGLPAGEYFVRISPRQSNDLNFYDYDLRIDEAEETCTTGATEDQACGNCGTRTRTCTDSTWSDFGACSSEGMCAPGDMRSAVCGNCGTTEEVCSPSCGWEGAGSCEGEGVCERGLLETEDCEGDEIRARTCSDECVWGDFSVCAVETCDDGDLRACYTGADDTAGVGVCREGRERCEGGVWGACQGQIVPANELCNDSRDNDCDGMVDSADTDCSSTGAELGSACEASNDCLGDFLCLAPPQHEQFTDGYCGDDDCASDSDCGDNGVCGELFGQRYCLRVCDKDADCRRGYTCAAVRDNDNACIPRCTSDDDCSDSDNPRCDIGSGICIASAPGNNSNPGNNSTNNSNPGNNAANNNTGDNNGVPDPMIPAKPADEGCAVAPNQTNPTSVLFLGLLGGFFWFRRRR